MNTQRVGLCAICANDRIGQARELDGRSVFVCNVCESEHPRAGGYSFDDAAVTGRSGPGSAAANGWRGTRGIGRTPHRGFKR